MVYKNPLFLEFPLPFPATAAFLLLSRSVVDVVDVSAIVYALGMVVVVSVEIAMIGAAATTFVVVREGCAARDASLVTCPGIRLLMLELVEIMVEVTAPLENVAVGVETTVGVSVVGMVALFTAAVEDGVLGVVAAAVVFVVHFPHIAGHFSVTSSNSNGLVQSSRVNESQTELSGYPSHSAVLVVRVLVKVATVPVDVDVIEEVVLVIVVPVMVLVMNVVDPAGVVLVTLVVAVVIEVDWVVVVVKVLV